MALLKNKTLNNGIEINYWVAQPRYNAISKSTEILMYGFLNQEARDEDMIQLDRVVLPPIEGHKTIEEVYAYVKESKKITNEDEEIETNFFVDAEDC